MKKTDIILSLITGLGVGVLFSLLIKDSAITFPYSNIILPLFTPFFSLFCLWIAFLIGKRFLFVFQLAKFLLIGGLFALFDLSVLNILMVWFQATSGTKYKIFVSISFIIATTIKYVADKYWAFEKKEASNIKFEFTGFFIVTLISLGIQTGIASFIVDKIPPLLGFSPFAWGNIGKIAGIIGASAWNFIGYKFWVFKK